jgi:YidC/Oxa1 family membrane protein insertase
MDYQRILIFVGLGITGYLLVFNWQQDYGNESKQPATEFGYEERTDSFDEELNSIPENDDQIPELFADKRLNNPLIQKSNAQAAPQNRLKVKTDVLEVSINLHGGDIDQAYLLKYPTQINEPNNPLILLNPKNLYSAQSGLIGPNGTDKTGSRPNYIARFNEYVLDSGEQELIVPITLENPINGLILVKEFVFRQTDYLVDVRYRLTNIGAMPAKVAFYGQIKRDGQDPVGEDTNSMGMQPFVGVATRTIDDLYQKFTVDDLQEESFQVSLQGGYIAFSQHYFLSAWIPKQDKASNFYARKLNNRDILLLGFTSEELEIAPGQSEILGGSFYMGPKNQKRLDEIAEGLGLTVDYGFLWWLAQPLFSGLTLFHSLVNNWGYAIILLTILVKMLLYPLSAASFRSMAKMRKLQPEMARLKERFGDDKQKFSQAMMEMYKKEGANPLGGCLPILLQMPVFLALYWTLMESVELRQAPFLLWIDDLSVMDPYFVLPILMGISMFLTQMMQPEPPDPIQAKVFKFLPIMMTFFFLWFPAGLVLYWLINNILSVLQQLYVTRSLEKAG